MTVEAGTAPGRRAAATTAGGVLIVNADDWGLDRRTTDAISRCLERGRVTSVSAMVGMADSRRAAAIAREHSVPAGLHLNLIEPFSGPGVPDPARRNQAAVIRWFGRGGWTRWTYNPAIRRPLRETVLWQLEAFRSCYGREPTHLDGHRHMHTSPDVLLARVLPAGLPVRASFTFDSGEKGRVNRTARSAVNRLLARRHPTTRWFLSIRMLHPRLGGNHLEQRLALAHDKSVEIMCHPGWDDEYRLLMSDAWARALDGLPLGSFADLGVPLA